MDYWKSKVLPKIKKVLDKTGGPKKAAATEACKSFDDSKEEYSKEFEEKKTQLQPKVVEIYEASSAEIKALIKAPKASGLKKYSTGVQKFLDELSKIEFPGSKPICEASSKVGPAYLSGPIFFVFEKVSTFIVTEEKAVEPPPETTVPAGEETSTKEKEIVVEAEKKEEVVEAAAVAEAEKTAELVAAETAPAEPAPAATEPPKVEEPAAAEPPKA